MTRTYNYEESLGPRSDTFFYVIQCSPGTEKDHPVAFAPPAQEMTGKGGVSFTMSASPEDLPKLEALGAKNW